MSTDQPTNTGPVDAAEAARLLGAAGSARTPATAKDVRTWAVMTAAVGSAMGLISAASNVSMWFFVLYVLGLAALIGWHRRNQSAAPRGAGRLYAWGVVGSGVVLLPVVTWLGYTSQGVGHAPWWQLGLAALLVALPALVCGALIARRGAQ